MEVYEKINEILREKKITKKDFSIKLRSLEPKLRNTGEVPSEKAIYSYLNGQIGLKLELIPYIAEALDIPEQVLFDDSSRARAKYIKHISNNMTLSEENMLKAQICKDSNTSEANNDDNYRYKEIIDLLDYAPTPFLKKLKKSLDDFKAITDKMD
jgi:transcriptional regulator with XRE-family HTH domain